MKIAFTGTRQGMTLEQKTTLLFLLLEKQPEEFHHRDCVGADEQAHKIVRGDEMFGPRRVCHVVIHPLNNPKHRAFCPGDTILPERPYLDRNWDIVDACDMLIACPKEPEEVLRSETWATIRYAAKKDKPIKVITPDGHIKDFSPEYRFSS